MNNKQKRESMGFTQQELAGYLGVDRTQLAKTEIGHRGMPYRALDKWARLRRCFEGVGDLGQAEAAIKQRQQERVSKLIAKQFVLCSKEASRLQQRLNRMEDHYQQCLRSLAFVAAARQLPDLRDWEQVSLNRLEARAIKKSWTCGPAKKLGLVTKLKGLTSMQQELEAQKNVFLNH